MRRDDSLSVVNCRIIGKFRLDNLNVTNPVAVGDYVEFELEAEDNGMIKKIGKLYNNATHPYQDNLVKNSSVQSFPKKKTM